MDIALPAILLGFVIASLYGALYHLIRDGGVGRLGLYLLLGWGGFLAGQLLGMWRGWSLLPLGMLELGISSIGSLVFLLLGDWLIRPRRGLGSGPPKDRNAV